MSKEKKKVGRPRKEIDKETFEKLCFLMCTEDEISGFFGCHHDTLSDWCLREYGKNFSNIYKQLSCNGKISIRRSQMKIMEGGNAAMSIWLGKQYLGQREQPEIVLYDGGEMLTPDERAKVMRERLISELSPLDNLCESNK